MLCSCRAHEREDERECADRIDESLADVNPGVDQIDDRRDVRVPEK
jgi:hypothetical protein